MLNYQLLNEHQLRHYMKLEEIASPSAAPAWSDEFMIRFCAWANEMLDAGKPLDAAGLASEDFGLPAPRLNELKDILNGRNNTLTPLNFLAGRCLAKLLLSNTLPADHVLELCRRFQACEGMAYGLLNDAEQSAALDLCRHIVAQLNEHPERGVLGTNEKKRFLEYYKNEPINTVSSLWRHESHFFWPRPQGEELLAILLAAKPEIFAPVINQLDNPYAARNLLFSTRIANDPDLLKRLLNIFGSCLAPAKEPQAGGDAALPQWNRKAVIAPLLLPVVIECGKRMIAASLDAGSFLKDCAHALLNREDGLYLAWSYIPELHSLIMDSKDKQSAQLFLDSLIAAIPDTQNEDICLKWINALYGKSFAEIHKDSYKKYCETGIMDKAKNGGPASGIISFCRLLPERDLAAESGATLLSAYRICWPLNERTLQISALASPLPNLEHEAIASLYAAQGDPAAAWIHDAHTLITPALFRILHPAPRAENTLALTGQINFHLAVGWNLAWIISVKAKQDIALDIARRVGDLCRQLYWLHSQRHDNFYIRVIANIADMEFGLIYDRQALAAAIEHIKSLFKDCANMSLLDFRICEMLLNNRKYGAELARNPEFSALASDIYRQARREAESEYWNDNRRLNLLHICESRLRQLGNG